MWDSTSRLLLSPSPFPETGLDGILYLVLLLEWLRVSHQLPGASLIGLLMLFVERNTSITTSQKSMANSPSIRSPASNEMISDSWELRDTDVCFLHIQLVVTNVRPPKIHKTLPKLILNPQGVKPIDNAEPCCPHDNIVGSHCVSVTCLSPFCGWSRKLVDRP